jgi:hypothetical protein
MHSRGSSKHCLQYTCVACEKTFSVDAFLGHMLSAAHRITVEQKLAKLGLKRQAGPQ